MMSKKRQTAAEAYADRRRLVTRQIAQLEQELARLDDQHRENPRSWPIVGTLGAAQERLLETVALLRGIEPGEVDR